MNIENDKWLYVYTHSAQRAREFFGLPPNAEVRLSQEQIEGALPCWAVKVPSPQKKEVKVSEPVTCPPYREELSNRKLACVAKTHLFYDGGFTLDEYGNPASGNLWAVSVADKERKIPGKPSSDELKAYLDHHPLDGSQYFGGWYDKAENVTYLDHTLLFAHKHTAVQEGLRNGQKAIYNLQTDETLELAEFS